MKKNYFLYAAWILCCVSTIIAQTTQEIFLKANQLYDEKQFEAACNAYQSLEPKDCVILFNIGNCYYHLNQHAQAIAFWKQAQKDASYSLQNSIRSNIAASQSVIGVLENNNGIFQNVAIIWFQLLFLFFLFMLVVYIKKSARSKKVSIFFTALLLITTISSGIILTMKYLSVKQRKGVVMKSNISLFSGPDEQYHVLASMNSASIVDILQERESWSKVRYNNIIGWVLKDSLMVV